MKRDAGQTHTVTVVRNKKKQEHYTQKSRAQADDDRFTQEREHCGGQGAHTLWARAR